MKIADDLERLCCAETEGKFFDYVTESIGEIIAALREGERLRELIQDCADGGPCAKCGIDQQSTGTET